ncbi:MAG: hypothetical protein Q4F03_04920 [Eubacteriales bacterium]|nr:hypothetical protein [Eubacteriales bacterium]
MKVKVIESFIDIHTGDVYPVGKLIDVTKERYSEILYNSGNKKYIEIIHEERKLDKNV